MSNRLFYLSIPPDIFVDVVRCASGKASSKNGWTRVIVEKPFGRDSESSGELTKSLKKYLAEDQIFRYVSVRGGNYDHFTYKRVDLGYVLSRTGQMAEILFLMHKTS